jgi:hypothetical protein
MSYPEPVQRLHDAINGLDGVSEVEMGIRSLDGLGVDVLSLPGEFADLPHALLRRTDGGLANELLVTAEVRFDQSFAGWIALEFLAWWVRDLSRSGDRVQMRPLALPPVGYGTQLGRTLRFVIEFFFLNPEEDNGPVLARIGELADWLRTAIDQYAAALENPTRAAHDSVESLIEAAEAGDSSAQLHLAHAYENGEDVEQDHDEAFRWYQRAAGLGHPQAVFELGLCYENGTGTEADAAEALKCYRQAAEGGHPLAMGAVGLCYAEGKGVKKNLATAAKWYRRGADAGEPSCQAQLGECYELGAGVKKDLREALSWYRLAWEQGLDAVQPAIERVEAALEE